MSILAALDVVGALLSGPPVTIGGIGLTGFEVPERITWGGAQRLTIHRIPGGDRVIDAMGRDEAPISWSGILQGSAAGVRAKALNQIRINGGPVPLLWGDFQRRVVVSLFECDHTKPYWMPYRITVELLPRLIVAAAPGLLDRLKADVGNALGINVDATLGAVTSTLATAQAALGAVGALTGGSSAALGVLGKLNAVSGAVNLGIGTASAVVNGAAALGANVGNLSALTASAGRLAALTPIGFFVQRAANNITAPAPSVAPAP